MSFISKSDAGDIILNFNILFLEKFTIYRICTGTRPGPFEGVIVVYPSKGPKKIF